MTATAPATTADPFAGALTVFAIPHAVTQVAIEADVVSVCPFNGHADSSSLRVELQPRDHGLELHAFRDYLRHVTAEPISHEHLAAAVAADVARTTRCRHVVVTDTFVLDEGLQLTVRAEAYSP